MLARRAARTSLSHQKFSLCRVPGGGKPGRLDVGTAAEAVARGAVDDDGAGLFVEDPGAEQGAG